MVKESDIRGKNELRLGGIRTFLPSMKAEPVNEEDSSVRIVFFLNKIKIGEIF